MKFNKWTIGLAAVGVVSLASAVQAEEAGNTVLTALSSTTLSGYVDTSAQWNFGTGNANPPPVSFNQGKQDGFNLDVVQLSLAKPLDESEWASGYRVDLWMGPDANALGTASLFGQSYYGGSSDFAIRQAYVALRTPVGNGIDWKVGVFDTIIGYESVASPNNPNYTHSYGFSLEPTTHTGVLGTYRVSDNVSIAAGIANTVGPMINSRASDPYGPKAESYKTYMGSVALTAPDNMGFLAGSTLYAGVVNGFSSSYGDNQTSWYVGATMATPVTGLRMGLAWDYLDLHNYPGSFEGNGVAWALGLYASYQATEKLSLHLRGEYLDDQAEYFPNYNASGFKTESLTLTAQYDLWKNVISRVEFRWDHGDNGQFFGSNPNSSVSTSAPNRRNAFMLGANIIYKF
jgi:Putative beta-barrel porin-2, OmpL-like. bbp2